MQQSTKMVTILAVGVFCILNTEMGIIGVLPYIAEAYNVSLVTAASVLSIFALGVAISGPTMPLLLSKMPRKLLMILVLAVFTITSLIAAWAPSFEVLLIARLVPALLHPVYCAMAFALAGSSVERAEAPKAVAKINMGVAAGMVVGVPVSHFLADTFGLYMAFLFSALITAFILLLTLWQIPKDLPVEAISYGDQVNVLKKLNVWLAILFVMALNGSIYGVYNYFVEYATDVLGFSSPIVSIVLLLYGALNIVGSFLAGRLLSRKPLLTVRSRIVVLIVIYMLFIGMNYLNANVSGFTHLGLASTGTSTAIGVSGLSWQDMTHFGLATVLIILWGILAGISANITQYWITTAAHEALNFANGLFLTAANVGVIVGTSFCGVVLSYLGLSNVMYGGIVMLLVAAGLGSWQLWYEGKRSSSVQI